MRLAYLDPHAVPGRVPEAMQILQTVDAFGAIGIDVTLAAPEPAAGTTPELILGRALSPRVRFERILTARDRIFGLGRSNRPFYRRAARWLADQRCDAVLVRNLKLAEHLLAHAPRAPIFFETHEVFARTFREEHARLRWRERVKLGALESRERFVYARATGLIALTPMLLEDVRAAYGTSIPGTVAPDGVDLDAAMRARIPRPANARSVVLYLGSLHPWKGVDLLVRAMAHAPDTELRIAGGNARRIELLQQLAAETGVADRVQFLGEVEPARRFAVINAADICALPLTDTSIGARYTSPLKLFEYMAMGKAIVASDLPSIRTVLAHETNALLVAPGDPSALGAALRRLSGDRALRETLGDAASLLAADYGWTARAAKMRDFIARSGDGTR